MSNLTIGFIGAVAVVLAGMLAWNAQALTNSNYRPGISYSLVGKSWLSQSRGFLSIGIALGVLRRSMQMRALYSPLLLCRRTSQMPLLALIFHP